MAEKGEKKITRTVCRIIDDVQCGLLAHVKDGVLVKVEPAEFPTPGMKHICLKGLSTVKDFVYHPDRLKHPLKREGPRGEGKWKRISWEEAFDIITTKFQDIAGKYESESIAFVPAQVGQSALMGIYLRLASALKATWIGMAGYGDVAGPCGDIISYGQLGGHHYTTDLEDPKICIVWGGNFSETHALRWRKIMSLKEKGAKLVVIDPRFTSTASKADSYLMVRPGTDTALILGMIKVVLDKGLIDEPFVSEHTVGPFLVRDDNGMFLREKDVSPEGSEKYVVWDIVTDSVQPYDRHDNLPALKGLFKISGYNCRPAFHLLADLANQYSLEKAAEITEVPPDKIESVAVGYATEKPAVFFRGWGMQRTFHGDLAWRAATALAAVTGNIKLDGFRQFKLNQRQFLRVKNQPSKNIPILQLYETIVTEKPYPVKALWVAGLNFINQNPHYNKMTTELLPRIDFIVTVDLFMNTTARYSDLVLPACSFYEYNDVVTPFIDATNPYMQLQQKVIEPLYESKSHVDIVNAIGSMMGFDEHFNLNGEEYLELLLSHDHPSVKGISLDKLKNEPVELPKSESQQVFNTLSGRIEFYAESMVPLGQELPLYIEPRESIKRPLSKKYPLAFITGHTRYLKCSTLANSPLLRELEPEPLLEMNPTDTEKRGIRDGDMVVAFNDRGKVELKVKIHEGVRSGVVNLNQGWWPENYAAGSHQMLTHCAINQAQASVFEPNAAFNDNLVEVSKVVEG
ncbi:molybdopterin-dependent oxidoreductase [Thermodesulfobacteriota bacterium]